MMIGAVAVEVWPFNVTEWTGKNESTFVEKAVLGRRPPIEAVGEGPGALSFSGRLFPVKLGGLGELEMLQQQRRLQVALPVIRGDGVPLGWHVITDLQHKHQRLTVTGVGHYVDIEFSLKASDPPAPAAMFGLLSGLFP